MKLLSPNEFTIGEVGTAKPLSLMLPTSERDGAMLIGQFREKTAAVFLSGDKRQCFFLSQGNTHFDGLIIPKVGIEIDETSPFDRARADPPPLSLIRIDTRLAILAKDISNPFRDPEMVVICENLNSIGDFKVAFTKWQVVLGDGRSKRVLWPSEIST